MARPPRAQRLTVWLNSKLVGAFDRAGSGAISFRYDNAWLAWPNAMPVSISLPLTGGNHNHYRIDVIQKRHFLETADAAGLPRGTVWVPTTRRSSGSTRRKASP